MPIDSFAGLGRAIADWLARDDLEKVIPDFIRLAEDRIYHRVRSPLLETSVLVDGPDPELPRDCLGIRALLPGDRRGRAFSFQAVSDLAPVAWSCRREGKRLFTNPTLATGEKLRLVYWKRPPPLHEDDGRNNPLFAAAPGLFLYGALREAAPYINEPGDSVRQVILRNSFEELLASVSATGEVQGHGGPLVMRVEGPACV